VPASSHLLLAATTTSSSSSSGSFLITPGLGLMVWTLVVFTVTMLLLRRFAFRSTGARSRSRMPSTPPNGLVSRLTRCSPSTASG
jgi:hypothetical protein